MTDILITGFTPFDGRPVNASWLAARALAGRGLHRGRPLRALEIPVCWGAPRTALTAALQAQVPGLILSMGEGEVGTFRIETRARNVRRERADNAGVLPAGIPNSPTGPAQRLSSFACESVCSTLAAQGIPICLSDDAGAYLCEELLYTLEEFKEAHLAIAQVLFVHVPPFGTPLHYQGQERRCSEALLEDFGLALLDAIDAQP
jgi:pyroglutamyl-peptidase